MAGLLDQFVDPTLLSGLSDAQRGAFENQMKWGLLSGMGSATPLASIPTAINGVYSNIGHLQNIQAHQRTLQQQQLADRVLADSMGILPGTGVGTSDAAYAPRDVNGQELAGPGYIPPRTTLDINRVLSDPRAPLVATQLKPAMEMYRPNLDSTRGFIYDKNDPRNIGKYFPELAQGQQIGANGVVQNLPGFVQSKASVTGAEENAKRSAEAKWAGIIQGRQEEAKAAYDLPSGGVYDPKTGNYVAQTRLQQVQNAVTPGATPTIVKPSAATIANQEAYKPILENAYAGYKLASERTGNLQTLRTLAEKLDTNTFTPAKAQVVSALRAAGLTGADGEKFINNYAAYSTLLNNQAAQNIQDLTGPKSNFDIQFTKERMANATSPRDANLFNLDFMMATDRLKQEKYKFIQGNPTPDAELRWQESEKNRSVYEDPALRKYLPQQKVVNGDHKGKMAYKLPNGEWKVFE